MKAGIPLTVIWEELASPDAQQRLAMAFNMLLSPTPTLGATNEGLDSEK
jgi:hypothetical protein